jgi:Tol biopolymer transport system component
LSDTISRLNAALEGRYRIQRELGAGGMATVYLAEDLRHDREVAIKVLRPELAAVIGGDRFVTEIKTTAGLQHPHILPLFDSGQADTFVFYVMPYVRGESLRDRLDREKQLPIEEAVAIAGKVAGALQHAHDRGVIHRDVKPANILLQDGEPVVADFGIALAVSAAGGGRLTETGLSLGTPHYMSPEQASADRDPDARSDVYALGCILYEMLVGAPPFVAPSAQATLVKILTDEAPPVSSGRKAVPPHVDAVVRKALEKLPADRFESAETFRSALANPSFQHAATGGVAGRAGSARSKVSGEGGWWSHPLSKVAAALVVILAALQVLGPSATSTAEESPALVSAFDLTMGSFAWIGSLSLDPDGSLLVFEAGRGGGTDGIYRRASDSSRIVEMQGAEGGGYPRISPDGRFVAFLRDRELRLVPIDGGASSLVATLPPSDDFNSLAWYGNDALVFTTENFIGRVAPAGGEPEVLYRTSGSQTMAHPVLAPNERWLLFTERLADQPVLRRLDLESGSLSFLLENAADARLVGDAWLLFTVPGEGVFVRPFDAEAGAILEGEPQPLFQDVGHVDRFFGVSLAIAANGTVVHSTGGNDPDLFRTLISVDLGGTESTLRLPLRVAYSVPRWSPDGRRLAYQESSNIWIFDAVTGARDQLTSSGASFNPLWQADGSAVSYTERTADSTFIWLHPLGSGEPRTRLIGWEGALLHLSWAWTSDGRYLVHTQGEPGLWDIWVLDTETGDAFPYLRADGWQENAPSLSPDDRWVAYESNEEGVNHIYVRSFPEPGDAVRVSDRTGIGARWARDGERLFYRAGDTVMVARVRTEGQFEVVSRQALFSGTYVGHDLHPDGDRFVVIARVREDAADDPAEDVAPILTWVVNGLTRLVAGS